MSSEVSLNFVDIGKPWIRPIINPINTNFTSSELMCQLDIVLVNFFQLFELLLDDTLVF